MEKENGIPQENLLQLLNHLPQKKNLCLFEQLWQEIFQTSPMGAHLSTNL